MRCSRHSLDREEFPEAAGPSVMVAVKISGIVAGEGPTALLLGKKIRPSRYRDQLLGVN